MRDLQRATHLVVGEVVTEGDVAGDGVVKDERLLGDQGRGLAGLPCREVAFGHVVDQHTSVGRVHQSHEQTHQRRLARSGRSDDRGQRSRCQVEVDVVQGAPAFGTAALVLLAEVDRTGQVVLVADPIGAERGGVVGNERPGAVVGVPGGGQHAVEAYPAGDRARHLGQHPAEGPHREGEHGEQVSDLDDFCRRRCAGAHLGGADRQDRQRPDRRNRFDQRVEDAPDAADLDGGIAQALGLDGEPVGFLLLASHHLDKQGGLDRFVGNLADVRAHPLGAGHPRRHVALEDQVGGEQQREDDQTDEREPDVDPEHLGQTDTQHDEHPDSHRERLEDVPGRLHVGVRVREQLSGRVAVMPRQWQTQVLTGDPSAVDRVEVEVGHAGRDTAQNHTDHVEQHHCSELPDDRPDLFAGEATGCNRRLGDRRDEVPDHARGEDGHHAVDRRADHRDEQCLRLVAEATPEDTEPFTEG